MGHNWRSLARKFALRSERKRRRNRRSDRENERRRRIKTLYSGKVSLQRKKRENEMDENYSDTGGDDITAEGAVRGKVVSNGFLHTNDMAQLAVKTTTRNDKKQLVGLNDTS